MGFSANTGMSFRTRLPSNSPRAGIQCLATRSRSKHERNVTQQPFLCTAKVSMNDLLKLAIEAYGGLERWRPKPPCDQRRKCLGGTLSTRLKALLNAASQS